ncbi:MAG TPA: hypothetical protein VLR89_05845 [Anaerolineaceae bacterium]|nr:hypothetical protein [Anaerolineaceae bacterium]
MNKWKQLLCSRKFWAAVIGLVFLVIKVFKPDFPLQGEEVIGLLTVLSVYIFGTALEDGLSALLRQ